MKKLLKNFGHSGSAFVAAFMLLSAAGAQQAQQAQKPEAWDVKNPDAVSNGNLKLAIRSIKGGVNPQSGVQGDAGSVIKAPWKYYGQPLCFSGTVGSARDQPPGSELANALGTSDASEVVLETDDGTIVDLLSTRSSGALKVGDTATLCGLVFGRAEIRNQIGGKFTHLMIVGMPAGNRASSSTQAAQPVSGKLAGTDINSSATGAQQTSTPSIPVAAASASGSGKLTTGSDKIFETVAGPLGTKRADGADQQLLLNGKPIFNGSDAPYQQPVALFSMSGARDAVLIASSGGRGNSCEVLYFFLVLGKGVKPTWTPEFGSCAPGGSYRQSGDKITLTIPALGKMERTIFNGTSVTTDGKAVAMVDSIDPSR